VCVCVLARLVCGVFVHSCSFVVCLCVRVCGACVCMCARACGVFVCTHACGCVCVWCVCGEFGYACLGVVCAQFTTERQRQPVLRLSWHFGKPVLSTDQFKLKVISQR
jgi:hypothetical protein